MAERAAVVTRAMTRDKLASFLKSQEGIKAFESIASDVGQVLPDATLAAAEAAEAAQNTASAAQIAADEALALVEQAQIDSDTARIASEYAVAAAKSAQDTAELAEHIAGQVHELRALLSSVSRRIDDIEQGPL